MTPTVTVAVCPSPPAPTRAVTVASRLVKTDTVARPALLVMADEDDSVFRQALERHCNGHADERTLALLERHAGRQPSKP